MKDKGIPQKAYICKVLLNGETITTLEAAQKYDCTNLPKEIHRSVEKYFGVRVARDKVQFMQSYGVPGSLTRYRLNRSSYNKPGIEKMKKYILQYFDAI